MCLDVRHQVVDYLVWHHLSTAIDAFLEEERVELLNLWLDQVSGYLVLKARIQLLKEF